MSSLRRQIKQEMHAEIRRTLEVVAETKQQEREANAHVRKLEKQLSVYDKAFKSNSELTLSYGQAAMSDSIIAVGDKIEAFRKEAEAKPGQRPLLLTKAGLVPSGTMALVVLEQLIGGMAKKEMHEGPLSERVGKALERELRWALINAKDAKLRKGVQRRAEREEGFRKTSMLRFLDEKMLPEVPAWTKEECVNIGWQLINLVVDADVGFISEERLVGPKKLKKTLRVVRLSDDKRAVVLEAVKRGALGASYLEPTIVKPLPWTKQHQGGYYTHFAGKICVVNVPAGRISHSDFKSLKRKVLPALNAIQEVPWRVNYDVLQIFKKVRQGKLEQDVSGMMKTRDDSCEVVMAQVENLARKLESADEFFFPHNLCWRGRVMALPTFSFQGPDYCRGLLEFANEVPLGEHGAEWLSYHIANSYGHDKKSATFRKRWAQRQSVTKFLCAIADDPMEHFERWSQADAPWQFLAGCFEWRRVAEGAKTSRLPVGFDGASNAIQHGSAFMRDAFGAAKVNLRHAADVDKPHDLYRDVSDAVNEQLNRRAAGGDSLAQQWLEFGVGRSEVKRIVMTRGYAGSEYGAGEMVNEDTMSGYWEQAVAKAMQEFGWERKEAEQQLYNEKWVLRKRFFIFDGRGIDAAIYLGKLAHACAMELLGGLDGTMRLLQSAVRDKEMPFVMPSGFVFRQAYHRKKKLKVEIRTRADSKRKITLKVDTKEIDVKKMAAGISANFTHATDASHLVATVLRCKHEGVTDLGLVHDSFSCHAGNAEKLFRIVRQTFVETHKHQGGLLKQFAKMYGLPAPQFGSYKLTEVLDAPYAFA